MKRYKLLVTGCVVVLAGACFAQQSQPQSLADLVKHAKKPTRKAVLVLSDEDIPPPPAQPAHDADGANAPDTNAGADSRSQSGSATLSKADDKKLAKPESKDQRAAELKQQLAKYQKEEDAWKSSVQYYQDLLANETSDFRRQMYQDSLDNDKKNAALFQQKIDAVQGELNKTQADAGAASASEKSPATGQGGGSQL